MKIANVKESDIRYENNYGYIMVRIYPDNPYYIMTSEGHINEHRLIMAQHLKRPLDKEEIVHHNNGKKDDNRIENLKLFKNVTEHQNYHRKLEKMILKLL